MNFEEEDADLVAQGSFALDRGLALKKLMRFQFPHPGMYALALTRCAVVSGATQIFLESSEEGRRICARFDGRAFAAGELEDPYSVLFRTAPPHDQRNRDLATGLLALLSLNPSYIRVASGKGKGRASLLVRGLDTQTLEPFKDDPQDETVVSAWQDAPGPTPLWDDSVARLVFTRCALSPAAIYVDGKLVERFDPDASQLETFAFGSAGLRGWLGIPPKPLAESAIDLYRSGVYVETVARKIPAAQVLARINDDRLRLNSSQTRVVRGAGLDRALAELDAQVPGFLRDALTLHEEWLADAADPEAALMESDAKPGRRTRWLRESARAPACASGPENPARKALEAAHLFRGADARPLSLLDLERARREFGRMRHCELPFPGLPAAAGVLLHKSPADIPLLRERFGADWADVRAALQKESALLGPRGEAHDHGPARGGARDAAAEIKSWLKALRRRKACALDDAAIDGFTLLSSESERLIIRGSHSWALNITHPMLRELAIHGGVDSGNNLAFLLSIYFSGLNRESPQITDADDAEFSLSLAELVLEREAHK